MSNYKFILVFENDKTITHHSSGVLSSKITRSCFSILYIAFYENNHTHYVKKASFVL